MKTNPLRTALEKAGGDAQAPVPDLPETPYFIYMTPRSGSTWLAELMREAGLGFPDEWLNHVRKEAVMAQYGRSDIEGYLRCILADHQGPSGASGIELPLLHLRQAFDIKNVFELMGSRTRHIYVRRENLVQQGISLYVARESGVYHTADRALDYALDPARIPYNATAIKQAADSIIQDEIWFERMFHRQTIKPLRLTYETLRAHPPSAISHIADYLEVEAAAFDPKSVDAQITTHPHADQWEKDILASDGDLFQRAEALRPSF